MACVILIAGIPAAGKSTFAKYISEKLGVPWVSKDSIKEILFDNIGFKSRAEKVTLGVAGTEIMYYFAVSLLKQNRPIILENNFEESTKPGLLNLINKYNCKPLTIRLTGDLNIIYKRFVERDKSPERHRGHVVNTCYPECGNTDVVPTMSFENFKKMINERGIIDFQVGENVIEVDCTDFSKIPYEDIIKKINSYITEVL